MRPRNANGEWVIWLTILAVAAYMASQYIGPLPALVGPAPAAAPSPGGPPQPKKRRWYPIFPARPRGLSHAPDR